MHCRPFTCALSLGFYMALLCMHAQGEVPADCPVTRPPDPPFVPPPPHQADPEMRFWLGSKALWTSLYEDGIWRGIASAAGVRDKFWWWSEGWTPTTDRGSNDPGLIVTARRLDREALPFKVGGPPTNGKLNTGWAMLVGLELPGGCWELTGNYRSEVVSMVVYVPPFERTPEPRRSDAN
jgi:hypothetical protein